MITMKDMERLLFAGGDVVGEDGRKIGSMGQLFLDASSGEPAWVTVRTGLFGTSESFVPLVDAQVRGDEIVVPYAKDQVKHAPRIDSAEGHLSPTEEHDLYRHYGLADDAADVDAPTDATTDEDRPLDAAAPASAGAPVAPAPVPPPPIVGTPARHDDVPDDARDDVRPDDDARARTADDDTTTAPVPQVPSEARPGTDDAMVLSAERARVVGTERVPTERVRLRRYTVTEQREVTVPVQREEVRVEYDPADGGSADTSTDTSVDGPADTLVDPGTVVAADADTPGRRHGRHVADSGPA